MKKRILFLFVGFLALSFIITGYVEQPQALAAGEKKAEPYNLESRIHPELTEAFSQMPVFDFVKDIAATRRIFSANAAPFPADDAVLVKYETIFGYEGVPAFKAKVYQPKIRNGTLPAVLWIHGGGYLFGGAEDNEELIINIVKEGNCVVVAPDYRLAPENTYPAAIDDCYATLKWMADGGRNNLLINTERIAVAGVSAGGGLTAAVALRARDEKGPPICFQMPLYPMLDDRNATNSSYQITDGRVWNRHANIKAWELYLGNSRKKEVSPYAAPARAADLAGLPPAYIMIGELDVFRDEVIDYTSRLILAGVPVELHLYPGCFHAFEIIAPQAPISKKARSEYVGALVKAINQ